MKNETFRSLSSVRVTADWRRANSGNSGLKDHPPKNKVKLCFATAVTTLKVEIVVFCRGISDY